MTECEPATQRTPREIWWKILEEFIYGEDRFILSTTFQGKRWSECSHWNMFWTYRVQLERFEKRRRTIGSVCRSWHTFSRSERHMNVTSKTLQGLETLEEIGKTLQARRVKLRVPWGKNKANLPDSCQEFD
jgi:hypothetical protein